MTINDFILEFSKINGKKPKAILICKEEKFVISIKDLPQLTSMGYLQKSIQKKEDISAGKFSTVLCFYYLDEVGKDKIIFKDVPLKLQRKAGKTEEITINGKKIEISYEDMEWEPILEIKYDLNFHEKYVKNYMNRSERTVNFILDW